MFGVLGPNMQYLTVFVPWGGGGQTQYLTVFGALWGPKCSTSQCLGPWGGPADRCEFQVRFGRTTMASSTKELGALTPPGGGVSAASFFGWKKDK